MNNNDGMNANARRKEATVMESVEMGLAGGRGREAGRSVMIEIVVTDDLDLENRHQLKAIGVVGRRKETHGSDLWVLVAGIGIAVQDQEMTRLASYRYGTRGGWERTVTEIEAIGTAAGIVIGERTKNLLGWMTGLLQMRTRRRERKLVAVLFSVALEPKASPTSFNSGRSR